MNRQFQFGLSDLFWAITWMAVWLGSWTVFASIIDGAGSQPETVQMALVSICWIALVTIPFMALGALFGPLKRWIIIGLVWGILTLIAIALFAAVAG